MGKPATVRIPHVTGVKTLMSLIDAVMNELNQGHIDAVAQQLGVSPDQAQGAIEQALPLLVGAMAKAHGTPQGAQALHGVLDSHAGLDVGSILGSVLGAAGSGGAQGGGGLGDVLGSVLGGGAGSVGAGGLGDVLGSVLGGGGNSGGGLGGQVLGQIFGGRQNQANRGLGQTTGLGTQNAAQLLAILAPIVMAVMARMREQQGMGHGDVGRILGGDAQRSQQSGGVVGGLMGAVLDRDGDGDVDLSDLMATGGGLIGAMRR
jgi:hypothetical protein